MVHFLLQKIQIPYYTILLSFPWSKLELHMKSAPLHSMESVGRVNLTFKAEGLSSKINTFRYIKQNRIYSG